jgi:hypothetical protein
MKRAITTGTHICKRLFDPLGYTMRLFLLIASQDAAKRILPTFINIDRLLGIP